MSEKYYSIVNGTFVIPIHEVGIDQWQRFNHLATMTAVPVYFCKERGVWPSPANNCVIVKEVDIHDV